jgi:hypothetical protein
MNITLTDADAALLRNILDSTYRDLKSEISHTDNSGFKHELREREQQIKTLLDTLGGPLPDAD